MFENVLAAIAPLLSLLAPFITEALVALLVLIGARVGQVVRKYLGVQAEKIMRDALHQAIETGLKQGRLDAGLKHVAAEKAIEYARTSVPEAIAGLGATQNVLLNIAQSKFEDLRKRGF